MRLFVYGTLKRGFWNHLMLGKAELVETKRLETGYELLQGGLPYLVACATPMNQPYGEVYEFDDPALLARLDRLEGHPNWYVRTEVEPGLWAYVMPEARIQGVVSVIPDGVYMG